MPGAGAPEGGGSHGDHSPGGVQGGWRGGGRPGWAGGLQGGYGGGPRPGYQGGAQRPGDQGADWRGGQHGWAGGGWNGGDGWRGDGERRGYDPRFYPRGFQSEHRFRWQGGYWNAPHGYYARHWAYGDRLPWGWFDRSYWLEDYYAYDLSDPPYGYEWIRLGADAVLVDIQTGTVVETAYGVFY
jgi:Ni/Co efflux regulator RcnB